MKRKCRWLLLACSVLVLAGCAKPARVCSKKGLRQLTHQVESAGGQFVEYGDNVQVDIPAWYLFKENSTQWTKDGHQLIKRVTSRMACYTSRAIEVNAYTSSLPFKSENRALGAQRARRVTSLLSKVHASRLIYQNSLPSGNQCIKCRLNRIELVTKDLT